MNCVLVSQREVKAMKTFVHGPVHVIYLTIVYKKYAASFPSSFCLMDTGHLHQRLNNQSLNPISSEVGLLKKTQLLFRPFQIC